MNLAQLAEKIDKRFDELRDKLDEERAARNAQVLENVERIAKVETKQNSQAGQIKLIFSLLTAGITGIITWITTQFK